VTFCFMSLRRYVFAGVAISTLPVVIQAEMKQLLTPKSCTQIRYLASHELTDLSPLELSPDGRTVAFVLQVPRISTNDNNEELFVSAADGKSSSIQIPVLQNDLIAAPHWFPDNKNLAVLMRRRGKVILDRVDTISRTEKTLWEGDGDITDYSMDAAGKTIAVAVRDKNHVPLSHEPGRDDSKGYRLDSESIPKDPFDAPRRTVYILRLTADRRWTVAQRVEFTSPLSGKPIKDIEDYHALHISLSPNGRYLLMDDSEKFPKFSLPAAWVKSPIVQYMSKNGATGPVISYLYDIHTSRATIPLDSPYVVDGRWAPDSKSYIKVAAAPAGSKWEASDFPVGTEATNHIWHMFHVDVATGEIREVLKRAENPPIAWKTNGEIVVRDSTGSLVTLSEEAGQWRHLATEQIPFSDAAPYSQIISDGERAVMEYENAGTAPELVAFDLSSSHSWVLAKFNPQVDNLILPQAKPIAWTTSTGYTAEGLLLLPPNYDPSHRYPLVIENGSILYDGSFVCDSGAAHVSSFARGILADEGIVYLMRFWPGNNTTWKNNYYPKGYPGDIAEAAFQQDLVESAVGMLTQRQIIDPAKVGLIGFSRGGWYVEYALTHSQILFRAATVTDNFQGSIVEYYAWHNRAASSALEATYGGPPYGKSLQNWLDYSISFNLDKINTPLLMEVNGYGEKDNLPNRPPDNLAVKEELFFGLNELNKPVELYYYPNEQHQVDHPVARIASLQRNVDWFRFWLQDYRRPNPEDPDQYARWELMRSEELCKPDHGCSPARGGDEVHK
jgi:dipeptidyl aminopeptidase/acylaminoacyl peptidase